MCAKKLTSLVSLLWFAVSTQVGADSPSTGPDEVTRQTYPTYAVADYVIGCMLANGATPEMLQKCSCSVDFIASAIPYDEYVKVETILRLQQVEGAGRNAIYKNSAWTKAAIAHLKDVQAESTLRCF
jgi:hypothetical protein